MSLSTKCIIMYNCGLSIHLSRMWNITGSYICTLKDGFVPSIWIYKAEVAKLSILSKIIECIILTPLLYYMFCRMFRSTLSSRLRIRTLFGLSELNIPLSRLARKPPASLSGHMGVSLNLLGVWTVPWVRIDWLIISTIIHSRNWGFLVIPFYKRSFLKVVFAVSVWYCTILSSPTGPDESFVKTFRDFI